MKSKFFWSQIVLFVVLASLTVIRWLIRGDGVGLTLLWWGLGGVVGFLFVFVDRFVGVFVRQSDELSSVKLKEFFSKWKTIGEKQDKQMIKSVLFVIVWGILTVLTITSIANSFSRGFMLGLGTHLIFELSWDYWLTAKRDIGSWFWQVRNVTQTERKIFVWGAIVFYLLAMWFL